jgi:hypothetical protein
MTTAPVIGPVICGDATALPGNRPRLSGVQAGDQAASGVMR